MRVTIKETNSLIQKQIIRIKRFVSYAYGAGVLTETKCKPHRGGQIWNLIYHFNKRGRNYKIIGGGTTRQRRAFWASRSGRLWEGKYMGELMENTCYFREVCYVHSALSHLWAAESLKSSLVIKSHSVPPGMRQRRGYLCRRTSIFCF